MSTSRVVAAAAAGGGGRDVSGEGGGGGGGDASGEGGGGGGGRLYAVPVVLTPAASVAVAEAMRAAPATTASAGATGAMLDAKAIAGEAGAVGVAPITVLDALAVVGALVVGIVPAAAAVAALDAKAEALAVKGALAAAVGKVGPARVAPAAAVGAAAVGADAPRRWSRGSTPEEVALITPEAAPGVRLMVGLTADASPTSPTSALLSTPSPFVSRAAKLALISDRQKLMVLE